MLDICKGFDDVNFNENVSHDVDFSLRIFARIKDEEVLHVERIVYYWRHHTKSFGVKESQKVSTYSKIAIKRYMDSKSIAGEVVDGPIFNSFRVRPTITGNPLISIIIPTSDKWELLDKCLASIEKNSGYENYEILIVKNNVKTDGAKRYHESLVNRYRVLKYDKEFNYSAINNFAAKEAKGDYLLLLNDDVEFITEDFLKSMLECFEFENIGVVGAKLLYPDNAIQHAGVIIGMNTYADHWQKFEGGYLNASEKIPNPGYIYSLISIRDFSAVTGACLMTPKALYEKIGGLSEDLKVGFNDVDYCLQARELGLKVLCTPYALGYHHEHASRIEVVKNTRNKELINNHEDRKVFGLKWRAVIDAGDPFYNSNLRTDSTVPRPKT
jgi:GT2 family glycosyltransferase